MKKPPKISFNKNAPGRYWYLYWIGRIIHEDGIFKVRYHFINTSRNDDMIRGYNRDYIQIHTLPIKTLFFFTPGLIYDSYKDDLITSANYIEGDKQNISVFAVSNYKTTQRPFSFLKSKYTPLDESIDFDNLNYFKFKSGNNYGNEVNVILPINVLCHYIYFKSPELIFHLLNNDVEKMFFLNDKKILTINEEKIGYVSYDNSLISEQEAKALAPFLFMFEDKGIHSLNAISLRLKSFFVKNKKDENLLNKGEYLDTDWPFTVNMNLNIQGKEFIVDGEVFFMAYKILSQQFSKKNLLTVDKVRVLKTFASTKIKDSSLNIRITGKTNSTKDLETTVENVPGNSSFQTQQETLETDSFFDFGISVELISKEKNDSAYNANLIPTDEELSKGTLNTFDSDPESEYIRQNFNSSYKIKIDRFDFVAFAVSKLKTEFNVQANYNALDKRKSNKYLYILDGNKVMIVELVFDNKYYYLVDYEKGSLGFINKTDFTSIVPFFLEIFVKKCLTELDDLIPNEYLWSRLKKKKSDFLKLFQIKVQTPLTHQVKGFKNSEEAALHMADKIFNKRILKIAN